MVRLDNFSSLASGNKLFKLLGYLRTGKRKLLSFGGAYSNHICALSSLANHVDMESIGVICGERPTIGN